jgi:hypothetical protein
VTVATDPYGLTATSTRTILIEAATPPTRPRLPRNHQPQSGSRNLFRSIAALHPKSGAPIPPWISAPTVRTNIWLTEDDIAALERQHGIELAPKTGSPRAITGHIDFLQVRNGAVHILDYKPDAGTNKPIAQLTIYALALTRRIPGLRLFDIKCAWFNEHQYCEFFPRTLLARRR